MKTYNFKDCGCKLFGVPFYEERKELRRLNDEIVNKYPHLEACDKRICGARLRFRTDSTKIKIRVELDSIYPDRGMSFYQANVCNAFMGIYPDDKYLGIISAPESYENDYVEETFTKDNKTGDITVFMPRNPYVKDINISVDDDAVILPPTPYRNSKPVLYYGSSITENGHTSSANAYNALLSRWLDTDYYNIGLSGAARGEKELADYINKFDMSIFVYDYDHNAPTPEHLKNTHEAFFRIFRSVHPETPVIMMSRPACDVDEDEFNERREIVRTTYENAVKNGDKNVYFIDGNTYFETLDRQVCTTDRTHPNDLGHYYMAKKLYPLMKELLYNEKI